MKKSTMADYNNSNHFDDKIIEEFLSTKFDLTDDLLDTILEFEDKCQDPIDFFNFNPEINDLLKSETFEINKNFVTAANFQEKSPTSFVGQNRRCPNILRGSKPLPSCGDVPRTNPDSILKKNHPRKQVYNHRQIKCNAVDFENHFFQKTETAKKAQNVNPESSFGMKRKSSELVQASEPLFKKLELDPKLFNGDYFSEGYKSGCLDLWSEDTFKLLKTKSEINLMQDRKENVESELRPGKSKQCINGKRVWSKTISAPLNSEYMIHNQVSQSKSFDDKKLTLVLRRVAAVEEMSSDGSEAKENFDLSPTILRPRNNCSPNFSRDLLEERVNKGQDIKKHLLRQMKTKKPDPKSPFSCGLCSQGFCSLKLVKAHVNEAHLGVTCCVKCGLLCESLEKLSLHQKTCGYFRCSICRKTYWYKLPYKTHMAKVHDNNSD